MKSKLCIVFIFASLWIFPQGSLNRIALQNDSAQLSFIVSGHLHGNGFATSGYPAASILANIDRFNELNPSMFFNCGDLYHDFVHDTSGIQNAFLNKLKMPFFNAVGNHDISGEHYQRRFGRTYFSFFKSNCAFFIADTEIDDSFVKGEQLDSLRNFCENVKKRKAAFAFIFSHRPIWCEQNEKLSGLFRFNTRGANGTNYDSEILPLLKDVNQTAKVYWFSGSLDQAPSSFFYHSLEGTSITYIQSAIRDKASDAVLRVLVKKNDLVFETVSLTNTTCDRLENFNLSYYESKGSVFTEEQFNFRLVPLYFKQMLVHRYFYYGILWFCSIFILLRFIFKWRRSK